ncbi:MAG TPA: GNAT family N-acetyltransferase [Thermomicrobiales bacterium]|nr:GNAT family N-acetyltransferase [Thermomicrobiales bacterium]
MNTEDFQLPEARDAFLAASILLERIVPGCVVDDLDGLLHIHYGRPKVGIEHEIVADDNDPVRTLAVAAAHPEATPAYLTTFAPLEHALTTAYEDAGLPRVVRNTLMACRLPDVTPFADPSLRRLSDPDDLRSLALVRGDSVLDVEYFTDEIGCYALDIDGELVSSALLIPSAHGFGVIEHVHTLAAYRRRGYGRWLLRALHAEAARMGIHQVVLGSNVAGRPLYTALGYVPLAHQDVYVVGG